MYICAPPASISAHCKGCGDSAGGVPGRTAPRRLHRAPHNIKGATERRGGANCDLCMKVTSDFVTGKPLPSFYVQLGRANWPRPFFVLFALGPLVCAVGGDFSHVCFVSLSLRAFFI